MCDFQLAMKHELVTVTSVSSLFLGKMSILEYHSIPTLWAAELCLQHSDNATGEICPLLKNTKTFLIYDSLTSQTDAFVISFFPSSSSVLTLSIACSETERNEILIQCPQSSECLFRIYNSTRF